MGSGSGKKNEAQQRSAEGDEDEDAQGDAQVAPSTKEAFNAAHEMWEIPGETADVRRPVQPKISEDDLAKALEAASLSQK